MSRLVVQSPATIFDMADYSGARTATHWAIVKEMHINGMTWLVSRKGEVLGLFGVYPMGDGIGEAWFNIRPEASKSMLALVRIIRLTVFSLPYREIVTICITPEGARVAKASGFEPSGSCEIGDLWTWTH